MSALLACHFESGASAGEAGSRVLADGPSKAVCRRPHTTHLAVPVIFSSWRPRSACS